MEDKKFRNENVSVLIEYRQDGKIRDITVYDLTDVNEWTTYTTSRRGLKEAEKLIEERFDENSKHNDIYSIFRECNLKTHSYCGLD